MGFSNYLLKLKPTSISKTSIWSGAVSTFVILMAPLFPHISEELWHRLGNRDSVHLQKWPQGDPTKAQGSSATVVVQVNSKVRSKLTVPTGSVSEVIEKQALELPELAKWLNGKNVLKVIVVENRLVNIITD